MPLMLAIAMVAPAACTVRAEAPGDVLKRFAPVVLQRCHGKADYLTGFDYDGNWNGADNWDNLDRYPLKAYVYTSAIETRSHWYLTYSFFHPRDWWPVVSLPHVNHENDLEGALVVVEKHPSPTVILMETVSHKKMLKWTVDPGLAAEDVDGPLRFEGERAIVGIRPWKHPMAAYTGEQVTGEKGVIYRYKGRAEQPVGKNDRDVGYEMAALKDTLWAHRFEIGSRLTYGEAADFPDGRYGSKFNGNNRIDHGADAPWFWGYDAEHGLMRGEWFHDPAKAMRIHFPRHKERFSTEYLQHPFRAGP